MSTSFTTTMYSNRVAKPKELDRTKSKPKEEKNVQEVLNEFQRANRMCKGTGGAGMNCPLAIVNFENMESYLKQMFNTADYGQSNREDKSDDEKSDDSSDSD